MTFSKVNQKILFKKMKDYLPAHGYLFKFLVKPKELKNTFGRISEKLLGKYSWLDYYFYVFVLRG